MRYAPLLILVILAFLAAPAQAADRAHTTGRLFASIPAGEREYYVTIFDYAMTNTPTGQTHVWNTSAATGTFTPTAPYVANGTICRNFYETLSVNAMYSMESGGLACKRVGRDGWCRLRPTDAKTCAMEPPETFIAKILRDASDGFDQVQWQGNMAGYQLRQDLDQLGHQGNAIGNAAGEAVREGYKGVQKTGDNVGHSVSRGVEDVKSTGRAAGDVVGGAADTAKGWLPF